MVRVDQQGQPHKKKLHKRSHKRRPKKRHKTGGFDLISPLYDLLASLAFRGAILKAQTLLLPELKGARLALMIGGGAGLAALAGALLPPGATEMPLVVLMLACSIASVLCILAVIRRARALGLAA